MILIISIAIFLFVMIVMMLTWAVFSRARYVKHKYHLQYIESRELGPYYACIKNKLKVYNNRDEDGGIMNSLINSNEKYFHPIENTHYAFATYEKYLETKDDRWRNEFLRMARAIINHGTRRDDGSMVWYYPHKFWKDQSAPWISAMAQGQVIGVMCRAFELTQNSNYLDIAWNAFNVFFHPIKEGGVCSDDCSEGKYYEEYAHKETKYQNHTLNGMLSALFNIYDFWKITQNIQVRQIFDEGVATIRANIWKYDFPFCSSYDLRHRVISNRPFIIAQYNAVHVAHLHIMAALSKDAYFAGIADCWDKKLLDVTNRIRMAKAYIIWKIGDMIKNLFVFRSDH